MKDFLSISFVADLFLVTTGTEYEIVEEEIVVIEDVEEEEEEEAKKDK